MALVASKLHVRPASSLLDQIGNTPLLRLSKLSAEYPGVEILAKAEFFNPGGSVKDRAGLNMIQEGLRTGSLTPERILLDATSGNTGIAYAMIGAALGYKVRLCLPRNASEERKRTLLAYGVDIVVSESTRKLAPDFAWQELDRVRVKGKEQAVGIFWPLAPANRIEQAHTDELKTWAALLKAYRLQDWDQCDVLLLNLHRMNAKKYLYELYSERVASMRLLPFDPEWDGATNFETK